MVLGLLKTKGKMTGSEIDTEFQNDIGEFWQTTHSQIYPELKRMVADDWISFETTEQDKKKKWYYLQPLGESELQQWLKTPLTANTDEEFPLKLFFIQYRDDALLTNLLQQELALHQEKLIHLKQRLTTVFADEATKDNNYGHHLILKRAIERETNNLSWLTKTLARLN
ncbi:PadR family transcriptional regulator [Lapidilactobacillus dextrinicus]|uniref:PadR family transcriptional regulator n=1 Tax=Lapidilactobacillus dextrinicus TaxID=51664 RepID=UPI001CE42BCB|nr:PadR family transcriptional regulator [Lapidilactobacillus dextrinicus]